MVQKYVQSKFDKLYNLTMSAITDGEGERVDKVFVEIAKKFKIEGSQLVQEFDGLVSKQSERKHFIIQGMTKVLTHILESLGQCEDRHSLLAFSVCYSFSVGIIPFAYELVSRFAGWPQLYWEEIKNEAVQSSERLIFCVRELDL